MQKQQKKSNLLQLIHYYKYNYKYSHNLNFKLTIIKTHSLQIKKLNYKKIILKLLLLFNIILKKKYPSLRLKNKIFTIKISKNFSKQNYFNNIFNKLKCYFFKNKFRFIFKKIANKNYFFKIQNDLIFKKIIVKKNVKFSTNRVIKLSQYKLWFLKPILKKKLKLSKKKLDCLYSFKQYFTNVLSKYKLKKIVISQIKLIDYSLKSKFKTSLNFENIKSEYGIIKIKPSGANTFITLTNFNGNVLLHYQLVFLMKYDDYNKRFKRSITPIREITCI